MVVLRNDSWAQKLYKREIQPPFKPSLRAQDDARYFDSEYTQQVPSGECERDEMVGCQESRSSDLAQEHASLYLPVVIFSLPQPPDSPSGPISEDVDTFRGFSFVAPSVAPASSEQEEAIPSRVSQYLKGKIKTTPIHLDYDIKEVRGSGVFVFMLRWDR